MKEQAEKRKVRADPDKINPMDGKPSAAEFLLFRSETDSDKNKKTE